MKLTLKNIRELKQTATPLRKRVLNYISDEWGSYNDKADIFKDVLYHGCQSGKVGLLCCNTRFSSDIATVQSGFFRGV